MKNVTILIDYETRKSSFLIDCGMSIQNPQLCARQTPTRVFLFQVFGLMINDSKLEKYVNQRDGIVVLIDWNQGQRTAKFVRMMEVITKSPKNLPILIVIENCSATNDDEQIKWLRKITTATNLGLIIDNDNDDHFDSVYKKIWFNSQVEKYQPISPKITSITITNYEMATQFENATLDLSLWDHYGRLRIVYISLVNLGFEKTVDPTGWLCTNWKKYKTTIGHQHLWHYSLTRFWAEWIYDLMKKNKYADFEQLYNENKFLHKGSLFKMYYTDDVLFSEKARNVWVPPNKNPNNFN